MAAITRAHIDGLGVRWRCCGNIRLSGNARGRCLRWSFRLGRRHQLYRRPARAHQLRKPTRRSSDAGSAQRVDGPLAPPHARNTAPGCEQTALPGRGQGTLFMTDYGQPLSNGGPASGGRPSRRSRADSYGATGTGDGERALVTVYRARADSPIRRAVNAQAHLRRRKHSPLAMELREGRRRVARRATQRRCTPFKRHCITPQTESLRNKLTAASRAVRSVEAASA